MQSTKEEKKFFSTLETGISILNKEILELNNKLIPGDLAFKLHDTYGFPIDLTADIAREMGFQVDEVGFERCMKQQIEISKQGEKFQTADLNLEGLPETNFVGYEKNNLNKESIISLEITINQLLCLRKVNLVLLYLKIHLFMPSLEARLVITEDLNVVIM